VLGVEPGRIAPGQSSGRIAPGESSGRDCAGREFWAECAGRELWADCAGRELWADCAGRGAPARSRGGWLQKKKPAGAIAPPGFFAPARVRASSTRSSTKKPAACAAGFLVSGGESGIRTRDTVSHIRTFQARSFNHSDTSPGCAPSPEWGCGMQGGKDTPSNRTSACELTL
jgi:hypothetical protein